MIQKLETSTVDIVGGGIDKTIDAGAMNLIADIVQSSQYQKPYESMVRELTSNAKDAIDEKLVAVSILSGQNKPEDHFITRDGELYKDSNWNPDYYDLNWLSDNNTVTISYIENHTGKDLDFCDLFVVHDEGVGIGSDRTLGVTSLGYSTKRNSQKVLGSFGLGAKSPLSTSVDYYILESAHNGKLIKLQIFNYKIVSLIGPININTGKHNDCYKFKVKDTEVCLHYENTLVKNYTKIMVPVKKVGRNKIDRAIKDVLPYVKGIKYVYKQANGTENVIDFQPKIEYESDKLIVTDINRYNTVRVGIVKNPHEKHHDVIISYGEIDFSEMGLNPVRGAVTIKCPIRSVMKDPDTGKEITLQDGIDVTPSRESIRYTSETIAFLKKRFADAVSEVSTLIEKKLQASDIVDWISECTNILHGNNGYYTDVFYKLVDIIDKSSIQPRFKLDQSVKYGPPSLLFAGLNVRTFYFKPIYNKNRQFVQNSIERIRATDWRGFNFSVVIVKDSLADPVKDLYIETKYGKVPFIEKWSEESWNSYVKDSKITSEEAKQMIEYGEKMLNLLSNSKRVIKYEDIVIPKSEYEQLKAKLDKRGSENDDNALSINNGPVESAAERRKKHKLVLVYAIDEKGSTGRDYLKKEIEPNILNEYNGELYYGNQEDTDLLSKAALCIPWATTYVERYRPAQFWRLSSIIPDNFPQEFDQLRDITILKVAKQHNKLFTDYKHISKFFNFDFNVDDDGILTVDKRFQYYLTTRICIDKLYSISFLRYFKKVNYEVQQEYESIERLFRTLYTSYFISEEQLKKYETLADIQVKMEKCSTKEEENEILEDYKKIYSFIPDNTEKIEIVITDVYTRIDALFNYVEPLIPLLSSISSSMESKQSVTDLVKEILDRWECAYIPKQHD